MVVSSRFHGDGDVSLAHAVVLSGTSRNDIPLQPVLGWKARYCGDVRTDMDKLLTTGASKM